MPLDDLSSEVITLEQFRFATRKQTHPNECLFYQEIMPCHAVPESELNCLLCFCPEYDFDRTEGGCNRNSKDGKWIEDDFLAAGKVWDCSDCIYPHEEKTVRKYLRGYREKVEKSRLIKKFFEDYGSDSELFRVWFWKTLDREDIGDCKRTYLLPVRERISRKKTCVPISEACYLAVVDRLLRKIEMEPSYIKYGKGIFMKDMGHSEEILVEKLGIKEQDIRRLGVLMFLNLEEPAGGTKPLTEIFPTEGEHIMLAYVIQKGWWRIRG